MTPESTKNTPPSGAPKHRACDECRARKLACSKEPGGCNRCRREGIPCHYSAQKPMGRPRKRRHVDDLSTDDALLAPPNATLDFFGPDAGSSTAFLDLLPSGLDEPGLSGDAPKDANDSWKHFVASHHHSPPEHRLPSSSSDLSTAVESPDPSPRATVKAIPSISCGCLSSLYLALESLAHLPSDVTSAMRVARSACKVAQDVVECRHCSNAFFDDPLKPPPIQGFQNLMFLGALVPSACNAYASILEMVDDKTASAKRENRTLFFSLKDMGALWDTASADGGHCCAMHSLNNKHLKPEAWQRAVRAVLKMDVYGLGGCPSASPPPFPRRKGLKDVLAQLDQTSRRRHEIIDELNAKGQVPKHSPYLMSPLNQAPCPPEQRNCVRIIETARMALDRLVIA
ncbi:uncharacterized protein HRG_02684 [Hirsutella rhossiliensis]|uniref:Zn(2)-C6 fungal-type domain-containing protein n=1 Tax=Hirsutella rhossiliensis TaxID=111463 RepID=A0A9P8N5F6_9HYPO|nr:uncharacterized protein HRG_02684 [Hirsutella rhossiliensis]KAH0967275.1 hypothetical protein HRG_02684 [Hirsutella rhossiliensis]